MVEVISNQLLVGDCLEGLRQLPTGCVQLVFADPPYNIGYDYDVYEDRKSTEEYLDWCAAWGREVVRVLDPTGSFWLAMGDEYAAELKILFHRQLGLHLVNWVIWYYTFGVHCQKKFARSHTHLFWFAKDRQRYTWNDAAVRVPSARQRVYRDRRADPRGRIPDNTWILRPQDAPLFTPEEDTWYFARICGTFRERQRTLRCQLPEALLERVLLATSRPGDLVLDPFAGTGTTLVVAERLGRRWLGWELSETYAAQAQRRLGRERMANSE
jgi:site-specific DNA-methyltransferase (adenine-specific)